MKNPIVKMILACAIWCPLVLGQDLGDEVEFIRELPGWGTWTDPDHDCKFFTSPNQLTISVPGSARGHDLAPEIKKMNAPRVTRGMSGDFSVQVRVEGRFAPGDDSTIEGRTGYNGAGIIIMSDEQNIATLVRAVLQREGEDPVPYINFEIRIAGKLQRFGNTADHPISEDGPIHLRLERKGTEILGFVSEDGIKWDDLESKKIPQAWPDEVTSGFVAISTSKAKFSPKFSEPKFLTPEKPEP